jgi:hypothetical protein
LKKERPVDADRAAKKGMKKERSEERADAGCVVHSKGKGEIRMKRLMRIGGFLLDARREFDPLYFETKRFPGQKGP